MEFSVRHFISGRIRLHLPSLCRKKLVAEAALVWLQTQKGVRHARLNFACACLVIEYDANFEGVLRATLGQLSVMSIADLQRLVGAADKPGASRAPVALTPAKPPSIWRNTPLALTTV
jgi:hypothetical protein